METVKIAYFYELKTHLGNARYRVQINIEIILWPFSINISNKKSEQSERALANIKDFNVGNNYFA